jgi:NAD-dependent deacetylase
MSTKIIVFSGAGMSAESGISTFRDSNGLWDNYNIHDVATPQAWESNPDLVTRFYNERRKHIVSAQPNDAHLAIAELGKVAEVIVITQNIDDLHERAGSENVLHLHGNIRLSKSSGPNAEKKYYPITGTSLSEKDLCPDGYRLRPHVVWFGEPVPMMNKASVIISAATHFVVVGSSLQVYPAAGLVDVCPHGAIKWIIDPKADHIGIHSGFKCIQKSAVAGIQQVIQEIKL